MPRKRVVALIGLYVLIALVVLAGAGAVLGRAGVSGDSLNLARAAAGYGFGLGLAGGLIGLYALLGRPGFLTMKGAGRDSRDAKAAALRESVQRARERLKATELELDRLKGVVAFVDGKQGKAFSEEREPQTVSAAADSIVPSSDEDFQVADECPICGGNDYSLACEYNRFITRPGVADELAARYDYSLCHACGALFARIRPTGERYHRMLIEFSETLGRVPRTVGVLNSRPLDAAGRADIARRAERGVFVSEHEAVRTKDWLPRVLGDRMSNAVHIELIGSLADLHPGARVLELRSKTGAISAALHRLHGADAYTMPIFESQQAVVRAYYNLPADHLIDWTAFEIPYEGEFDLIIANHMLTHVIEPRRFFAAVRGAMRPGGLLYTYNDPDDREILDGGGLIFSVLNPFHLQTFDRDSLVRALQANQFDPEFVTHTDGNFVCLSRYREALEWTPIASEDLAARRAAYARARDTGIVRLPEEARPSIGAAWEQAVRRLVADGLGGFDERGRFVLQRLRD